MREQQIGTMGKCAQAFYIICITIVAAIIFVIMAVLTFSALTILLGG